jgi:hypothetical protein
VRWTRGHEFPPELSASSKIYRCHVIDASAVRKLLDYDAETGVFTWRVSHKNRARGDKAGSRATRGYIQIHVQGHGYLAHRLAWLYVHGEWPTTGIDHINGKTDDNRISNLRLATHSQNGANAKRYASNTSGFKGVYWNTQVGKWNASIRVKGKRKFIGHFASVEDAARAYRSAAVHHFGEFAESSARRESHTSLPAAP